MLYTILFSQSVVVHGIVSHDDAFLRHLVSHASRKRRARVNPIPVTVLQYGGIIIMHYKHNKKPQE